MTDSELAELTKLHPELSPPAFDGKKWSVVYRDPRGPQHNRLVAVSLEEQTARTAYEAELLALSGYTDFLALPVKDCIRTDLYRLRDMPVKGLVQ